MSRHVAVPTLRFASDVVSSDQDRERMTMAAYMLVDVEVLDPGVYAEYGRGAPAIVAARVARILRLNARRRIGYREPVAPPGRARR